MDRSVRISVAPMSIFRNTQTPQAARRLFARDFSRAINKKLEAACEVFTGKPIFIGLGMSASRLDHRFGEIALHFGTWAIYKFDDKVVAIDAYRLTRHWKFPLNVGTISFDLYPSSERNTAREIDADPFVVLGVKQVNDAVLDAGLEVYEATSGPDYDRVVAFSATTRAEVEQLESRLADEYQKYSTALSSGSEPTPENIEMRKRVQELMCGRSGTDEQIRDQLVRDHEFWVAMEEANPGTSQESIDADRVHCVN
jgi:hypothetical protein